MSDEREKLDSEEAEKVDDHDFEGHRIVDVERVVDADTVDIDRVDAEGTVDVD
jgi:hypothetical protein